MTLTFRQGQGLSFHELMRMAAATAGTYLFPDTAGGAVTPSSGLTVAVAAITGTAITINGAVQATAYAGGTLTAGAASTTLDRIDTVYYDGTATAAIAPGTPVLTSATVFPVPPTLAAGQIAAANLYIGKNYTSIASGDIDDRRQTGIVAPTALTLSGLTKKYKSATQVFTTSTAFADVIAAGSPATMSFTIAANEVWMVEYIIHLTFGGTGGAKFQLTGPAAPTHVDVFTLIPLGTDAVNGGAAAASPFPFANPVAYPNIGFSASFAAMNSAAGNTSTSYISGPSTGTGVPVIIRALIANGSTAGTVTLQAAQNSSNSTTTLGIGSFMRAERVA